MLQHHPKLKELVNKHGIESPEFAEILSETIVRETREALKTDTLDNLDIEELLNIAMTHCNICGVKLKQINKYTFKYPCKCHPDDLRVSSG